MFRLKRLCLFSALLMITLIAAGCESNNSLSSTQADDSSANAQTKTGSTASSGKEPVELLISAAASLTESLDELKTIYEADHSNVKLTYNFGASGTLQQQIEQGAPADVFLSAGTKQMNSLLKEGYIAPDLTKNFLTNELVLIVPQNGSVQIDSLEDLNDSQVGNIAIGTPESVPAGKYAEQTLTFYKLWDGLAPKLVQTKDVKQVLSYVETGNADAGFVYKTDAASSKGVKIVLSTDPESHDAIEYPAGVIKDSKHPEEAKAFYDFLLSDKAQQVFEKYGFTPAN
ncbi:molybdate ABC transporter substrate-binding protein [Paenibacillus caui]|uniref:molybdate ABC transporter substrate-binding protein n=1 Tax=Paenibacillus caui TaxID=2873927 RepID=UPI001CA8F995|nr:molybdate ABC transporter substrate-binding protein [Paenibacillus caui]